MIVDSTLRVAGATALVFGAGAAGVLGLSMLANNVSDREPDAGAFTPVRIGAAALGVASTVTGGAMVSGRIGGFGTAGYVGGLSLTLAGICLLSGTLAGGLLAQFD